MSSTRSTTDYTAASARNHRTPRRFLRRLAEEFDDASESSEADAEVIAQRLDGVPDDGDIAAARTGGRVVGGGCEHLGEAIAAESMASSVDRRTNKIDTEQ